MGRTFIKNGGVKTSKKCAFKKSRMAKILEEDRELDGRTMWKGMPEILEFITGPEGNIIAKNAKTFNDIQDPQWGVELVMMMMMMIKMM